MGVWCIGICREIWVVETSDGGMPAGPTSCKSDMIGLGCSTKLLLRSARMTPMPRYAAYMEAHIAWLSRLLCRLTELFERELRTCLAIYCESGWTDSRTCYIPFVLMDGLTRLDCLSDSLEIVQGPDHMSTYAS